MSWLNNLFRRKNGEVKHIEEVPADPAQRFMSSGSAVRAPAKLPRFHGTAGDQVRAGTTGKLDQIRFRLRNSFTPSRPVTKPGMFAGRAALLTSLIRSIEDQQLHVVLFGARGIGKTSTLHILCQIAQEARYMVRYSSCSEDIEFDELFRAIFEDIPLLYHANYEPTADEIEEGLSFGSLVGEAPLTVSQASDILSRVSSTRLLIVLDEFDRVRSSDFRRSIAELIKNLSDRASRVQLVVAGVASNLTEIIEHIPSIRRNILGMPVPVMIDEEVMEMIQIGEAESGLRFSPRAARLICDVAHGLPYLTALISLHAGLAALEVQRFVVLDIDVSVGVHRAFEEIELRLSPETRHLIDRAVETNHGEQLDLLTRSALRSGGRVVPGAVEPDTGTVNPDFAVLQRLSAEYGLLNALPADPSNAFTFKDEGAPLYFWMREADQRAAKMIAEKVPS